jgi:2-oxoacid dehydrogenases acyltransferase (catalytic domain)
LYGTPIINLPQAAVLGMHGIKEKPVVVDGQIVIRPIMVVALTYDHRLLDGREGVTFLGECGIVMCSRYANGGSYSASKGIYRGSEEDVAGGVMILTLYLDSIKYFQESQMTCDDR